MKFSAQVRLVLGASVFALLAAVAVLLLLGTPQQVTAQGPAGGQYWNSSAEPPPGTRLELLSAPDSPRAEPRSESAAAAVTATLRVAGSALRPRENDVTYAVSSSGGCSNVTSGDTSTVWNAPLYPPQGARITSMRFYFNDTNAATNSSAWFTIYSVFGVIANEYAASSTGSAGNGFSETSAFSHTVDYNLYSYVVNWRPNSATGLSACGFVIFYEPPPFGLNFVPMVTKP